MEKSEDRPYRFVNELQKWANRETPGGRAVLAAMRRGLGKRPGEAPEMYPYLVPWTAESRGWTEQVYYLVASLFALHQQSWEGGDHMRNFGASLARLNQEQRGESTERRFVALLASHRDALPEHLRHAVSLCEANDIPIDWVRLLRDLPHWDDERRWVQLSWARAFWQRSEESAPSV